MLHHMSHQYDLSSLEFVSNPYPTYERLLANYPIYGDESTGIWYISSYRYVTSLFKDSRFSSNRVQPLVAGLSDGERQAVRPLADTLSKIVLFLDPPKHTPIRKAINKALTLRLVTQMTPRIQALVNQLIEDVYERGYMDIIADVAYPLPAIVIAEMLGANPKDRDKLKQWSDDLARFLGAKTTANEVIQVQQSVLEMREYFRHVLKRHYAKPGDNLLGSLLTIREKDKDFTDDDLLANCVGLIFAGHETTTNLIANGLLALLKHPEQMQALKQNPSLITMAVEECLRYESPVQRIGRIPVEDIHLNGICIPKGQRVFLLLGAANRDHEVFSAPNAFHITRAENRHLAFGYGTHSCPGAALGKLEANIAINSLISRLNGLELRTETPQWQYNLGFRAMEAMPIAFKP